MGATQRCVTRKIQFKNGLTHNRKTNSCIGIYNSCKAWFPSDATSMEQYTSSQVYKYLWVMIGISGFGILFNLLPPVANWQEGVINRSINLNKSIEAESKMISPSHFY